MIAIHIILTTLICLSVETNTTENDENKFQKLCLDQEFCDDCLQAHKSCEWCYQEDFHDRRCNIAFSKCDPNKIERNSQKSMSIGKNEQFSVIPEQASAEQMREIIQIKPQSVDLTLRKGEAVTFNFTYKPASNYPLDLYYLGDLSASMEHNLEILKTLGNNLKTSLTDLTKNYKLAYGSFMDKTDMPFYFTDPESLNNPCYSLLKKCEKGYLFRHRLNFTDNTNKFSEVVNNSTITANVDDLDGALDAILQILVCGKKIGWSSFSRKIIILPTDSLLHTAGDGKLVGAVLKPTEKCMLDETGNHAEPLKYDYPSLEQITILMQQKKVNIIFAVKDGPKFKYYESLSKSLLTDHSFVTKLDPNSGNILQVIEEGYYNFAEQVNFYINTTNHPNIKVEFEADCENKGRFNRTSSCYGIKDKPVNFRVTLTLEKHPEYSERGQMDTLFVEEKNIAERLEVSISYAGICKCVNKSKVEHCENGEIDGCGDCICKQGWKGKNCTEECDETTVSCRKLENGKYSQLCSENGVCECGKCICKDSYYQGKYCEFECPLYKNQICGGPAQGECIEGKCICESGYVGETCSCSLSTIDCTFDGTVCSKRGTCECNRCKCQEGFFGNYCESNRENNNTICETYDSPVEDFVVGKNITDNNAEENHSRIKIFEQKDLKESNCGEICSTVIFDGSSRCEVNFCYYAYNESIYLPIVKKCFMTAGFMGTIGGALIALFTFLAGIAIILMVKWKRDRADRLEYERLIKEQGNFRGENPFYKSPVTIYLNPMRGREQNN
nr:integrin beta-nu-like isoform X1 [Leptinotarsa decemlineata]